MIGTSRNVRVYACPVATDMRKGYNGLFGMVREVLGQDPLSGHLFLFVSRDRRSAKVLLYDGTGLCIYSKRLQQNVFVAPWERCEADGICMTQSELSLFLEGSQAVRKKLSPDAYFPRETCSPLVKLPL